MNFFNKRRVHLVQKMIKNFDQEKDNDLRMIIDLIKKTDFSLKVRYCLEFKKLKSEIDNSGFLFIGKKDGYGSKESIKKRILKIQEILLTEKG